MKSLFSPSINNGAEMFRGAKIKYLSTGQGLVRRRAFTVAFCLLSLFTTTLFAADIPQATVAYRPGDTVHVFIKFAEPISLKNGWLRFGLEGQLPDGQKVFAGLLDANNPIRLSEQEYEFDAKIGDHVAEGTYELSLVTATDQADLTRAFTARTDFPLITICVKNDRRAEFPNIQNIRLGEKGKDDVKP